MNPFDWALFDPSVLQAGQKAFYEQFLAYAHSAATYFRQFYKLVAPSATLRPTYLAERHFNARAKSLGDENWIGINASVPCLLHFCYNNVMRLPEVLPSLGNASSELPYALRSGRIPVSLDTPVSLTEAIELLPSISRPKDEARAFAATAFTEIATTFCVLHEVAHIIGGHTKHCEQQFRKAEVVEFFGLFRRRKSETELRRVWEFEADKAAAMMLMNFVLASAPTRQVYRESFGLTRSRRGYTVQILGHVLFALNILFRFLAQNALRIRADSFHPHPDLRISCVHGVMALIAGDKLDVDRGALEAEFDRQLILTDVAWAKLGIRGPKGTGSDHWDTIADQMLELEDQHQKMMSLYQKLAWVPPSFWRVRDPGEDGPT